MQDRRRRQQHVALATSLVLLCAQVGNAFVPSSMVKSNAVGSTVTVTVTVTRMTDTTTSNNSNNINSDSSDSSNPMDDLVSVSIQDISSSVKAVASKKREKQMSQAIPFLERPPLLDGELAGDFGFDPLRLARNKEALWAYREAEIKHARLAMLAAVGWPVSELLDRSIAAYFGVAPALDDADRVPFFLYHHDKLQAAGETIRPEFWGFCLGMSAAIDSYGVRRARSGIPGYIPGDLGWDPLRLYPIDEKGKRKMQLAEIQHGRTAMLAVTGYVSQEAVSQMGIIDETPFFFFPITETAEKVLEDVVTNV